MANLANGDLNQQTLIVKHPRILSSLRSCMSEAKMEACKPAVACVSCLIQTGYRQELQDAGIITALRNISSVVGQCAVTSLARQAVDMWERS